MLQRLGFPSLGDHRRFVTAMAVDAVGSGVFMPLSMLYFLAVTPLGLVQVGAALSVAALVALPAGPVIGTVVDRLGARRVLLAGNVLQAVGFAAYLVVDSFLGVLTWSLVVTVGRTAFWGSYGALVAEIAAPGERERWYGFLGALRNVGFAVGGLVASVVVMLDSPPAFEGVVAVNAATYLLAFWLLLAVPAGAGPGPRTLPGDWRTVVADRPYRLLVAAQFCYSLPMMLLTLALPVYAVTVLALPGWIVGVVFTANCLMVGFGQGFVVDALTGRVRYRVLLLTQAVLAAAYLVFWAASRAPLVVATAVVLVGSVVYTLAELLGGPVLAALAAESAPAHLRGRYLSMIQLAWDSSGAVGPVLFAWLLERGPGPLWTVMLGFAVVGGLLADRLGRVLATAAAPVTNRATPVSPTSAR